MVSKEDLEQLTLEWATLRAHVKEQDEALKNTTGTKLLVVLSSRRLDRFRDKPEKATDQTVQEWV